MRIAGILAIVLVVAACDPPQRQVADYRCGRAAADGPGVAATFYRLHRSEQGGSMGAPAQATAYRLVDVRDGTVVLRCSRGFLDGMLVCSRRLGDSTGISFRFDRAAREYRLARPAEGEGEATPETGRCVRD